MRATLTAEFQVTARLAHHPNSPATCYRRPPALQPSAVYFFLLHRYRTTRTLKARGSIPLMSVLLFQIQKRKKDVPLTNLFSFRPNLHTGISSNSAILGADAEIDQGRRGGPSISVLPSELLLDIFQFLPPFELIRTIPLNGILRCIWLDGFELSAAGFSNFLSRLLDIRISKIAARLGLPSVSSRLLPDSPRFLEYLRDDGLEILSISFAEYIDDSCLPHIACLASLVELALRKGRLFTSQALCDTFTLARQSQLRYLRHLDLTDCPAVNDAVVKAVCECCGPLLVALFLNWCWSVTDVGLMRILEACHSLQHLSLVGNHVIIGESFINLPTSQPHLRILNLAQCNQVLDSVLSSVAIQMRDLYIFDYFGERVGGSLDDVCQFDLARSMNKVPICEH
nr:unnamed protein product [Spirometra erinaceieuropaei]